jgi:hypothetical protein
MAEEILCPKCGESSGDDWVQCEGSCPFRISPVFDENAVTNDTVKMLNRLYINYVEKFERKDNG